MRSSASTGTLFQRSHNSTSATSKRRRRISDSAPKHYQSKRSHSPKPPIHREEATAPANSPCCEHSATSQPDEARQAIDYGVMMLHGDAVQTIVTRNFCQKLFHCRPLIVAKPADYPEGADTSIQRLADTIIREREALAANGLDMNIRYIMVEANYSRHGQVTPNETLLEYIAANYPDAHLFAVSSTKECLADIAQNEKLTRIITSAPPYLEMKAILCEPASAEAASEPAADKRHSF